MLHLKSLLSIFSSKKEQQKNTTPPINLYIEEAGTLHSQIPDNRKGLIEDLTLSGFLNSSDILFLREMSKCESELKYLNLENANIVDGGFPYFNGYKTNDDSINEYMFCHLKQLIEIILPKNTKRIIGSAFSECTNLKSIIIHKENKHFASVNGVIFNKDKSIIIAYPSGITGNYSIPLSVIEIADGAFHGCTKLKSIKISNNVEVIHQEAFFKCKRISSIEIPNKVKEISDRAFSHCDNISKINMKSITPPLCNSSCFSHIDKDKCNLYIPYKSYPDYWIANGWADFNNMIEKVHSI